MNIHEKCPTCARAIATIADALNGPDSGPPAAITVGNLRSYLVAVPSLALIRHEEMHTSQCERYCPRWLRWAPRKVRIWAGTPKFLQVYARETIRVGYWDNVFEIEARMAEGVVSQ